MRTYNLSGLLIITAIFLSLLSSSGLVSANTNYLDPLCQAQTARNFTWQAPLPGKVEFIVGNPGNFYPPGNCNPSPCKPKCHCPPTDEYAIDINVGENNQDCGIFVLAAADGWVKKTGYEKDGYGNYVVLSHPNQFQSLYAHLLDEPFVKDGFVAQGTPLGKIGSTGMSTACHLHFSVYYKDATGIHSSKPEPLGTYTNLTDGQQVVSSNYGAGYEEFEKIRSPTILHQPIQDTYSRLREIIFLTGSVFQPMLNLPGGNQIVGSAKTPVLPWQSSSDIFYQEFDPFPGSMLDWANFSSGIVEIKSMDKAYFIAGPIWEMYLVDGGPIGKWGKPQGHSYNLKIGGDYGLRSDFDNGSIIWKGVNQYEFITKTNNVWEGQFFNQPNTFSGVSAKRIDENIHFRWDSAKLPGPVLTTSGFSVKWETYHQHLIELTTFKVDELQGNLTIKLNDKIVMEVSSPDEIINYEKKTRMSIGQQHVEVFFWQEGDKGARISLTAKGPSINLPVYADGPPTTVPAIDAPALEIGDYEPPPYPDGSNAPTLPPSSTSSTVLVFDTSGSMSEPDSSGQAKIDAARRAGTQILNIISAENSALGSSNQIGVVGYSTTPYVVSPLTANIASLFPILDYLVPTNRTGMADGLKTGIDLFGSSQDKKILILLSDGLPNIGLNTTDLLDIATIKQQILDLATQAGQNGVCIYTVGFGDPNIGFDSIDEGFLAEVANASGCGAYYNAVNAIDLANVYVELRHVSTGNIVFQQSGQISQGQQLDLGQFEVPENQEIMLFTLNWPGSKLQAVIKDPSGTTVDPNYPGASISEASTLLSIILDNPKAGNWTIGVVGVDVPEGTTVYNTIISTRAGAAIPPPTKSGSFPIVIIFILLAGSAIGVYVYSNSIKRAGKTAGAVVQGGARLVGSGGEYDNQTITIRDGLVIGRGSGSDIRLSDPSVSRWHARIRLAQGAWFIQDQGSKGGIYVNGQRVNASRLNNGDSIQIGNNSFRFLDEGK